MQRLYPWEEPARVGERVVAGMREGDVARAEGVVLPEDGDGVAQLVAAGRVGSE